MQTGGSDDDAIVGINVTPLVDVCLVLVIIFMVTAPILSNPVFQVNLPKSKTQEGREGEQVVVSIGPDGKIAVEDVEVGDSASFAQEIRRQLYANRDRIVVFKADKDSKYKLLVDLMQKAKEAGASSMTVATDKRFP